MFETAEQLRWLARKQVLRRKSLRMKLATLTQYGLQKAFIPADFDETRARVYLQGNFG